MVALRPPREAVKDNGSFAEPADKGGRWLSGTTAAVSEVSTSSPKPRRNFPAGAALRKAELGDGNRI